MAGSDRRSDVLIAGGGIGGLAAALALSQVGARVIVVERAATLATVGAGLQISPNSSRILRRLGLLDAVSAAASRPAGIRVRAARNGRTLSFMSLAGAERRWGAPYLVMRRAALHDVLAAAVAGNASISLRLGTALAGFGATRGGVQATLKQGALTRTLDAGGLIGADGIRSAVRARLASDGGDAPQQTGRTAWRALIDMSRLDASLRAEEVGLWLGRDAHLVHYAVDGGRFLNVVAVTSDPTRDPDATWSEPGDPATIAARFGGWHKNARGLIAAAPAWATWPLFDRAPLAEWHAGPVALLGDAAHPVLPFLAQGAAQAIEDAAALAQAYAATPALPDAFAAYSHSRLARATRVQEVSRQLGRLYHLGGVAAAGRNIGMAALGGQRLLARYDWLYGA